MKQIYSIIFVVFALVVATTGVQAGEADVVDAKISLSSDGSHHFDVTVKHKDAGWEHYADRWEVLDEHGNVLGERVLFHPHDKEQPFTRSLSGVKIPKSVLSVTIRAHDKQHKFGGKEITLKVPR